MRFENPELLLLLLLAPLALQWRQRPTATIRFPHTALLKTIGPGRRASWLWLPPVLRAAAIALIAVALARPQSSHGETHYRGEGIDIVLAVDVSGSMLAEDFTVEGERRNRLEAVKWVVRRFLERRGGDRIGLVLFAARPYTQAPLSLDHGWLLQNLDRAEVGMIEDGTAIGTALATAVARLEDSQAPSKVVILLTDGRSNAGSVPPVTAADAAKALGYKVYTIGVGSRGLAPYPVTDMFGNRHFRPQKIEIDEETLREIARRTGGRYFRATDTEALEAIYEDIDALETSPSDELIAVHYQDLYAWLLLPGLLLLGAETALRETWLRTIP